MPDQIVIIHGFLSTPRHHWFRWLQAQFERQGARVVLPRMPSPRAPLPEQWLAQLRQCVPAPSRRTWFVAHSLGCATLLRYLSALKQGEAVGGAVLVAGFAEPLPALPELNAFTRDRFNFDRLKQIIGRRVIVRSLNDDVVPPELTATLGRALAAEMYSFPEAGHFRRQDGFMTFPALLELLKRYLPAPGRTM
ncbi:RBBP9/YdeN family alpha/beta hydrolase [Martelella alba]|uniref:Serine hydrolase family protein n=1 Tax=Martelella alba TaxID=2590451 RepID=A0ABY2SMZ0_9HYPH|nr:alpha/beta fold hydrolase [Martelella alba]TKI06340.1 serine hydrolase family protein [Martelella alba]